MAKEEFPKTLHHPHFRKGKITELKGKDAVSGKAFTDYQGEPDLFPDVVVNNPDQEAFYRAKGYLPHGEVPPAPIAYCEYPVMLSHPDHVDAVPDDFDIKKGPSGEVISTRIPGSPEKFPPVMAKDSADEDKWVKAGYKRIGNIDAAASERAKASPYDPDYKVSEYPKIVDGKIVDPHATMDHNRYPMYVGNVLVNSAAEEVAARGEEPILPAEKCIICGEPIVVADGGWGNGVAGPFHLHHINTATEESHEPPSPPGKARTEAGKKAAETRKAKKERERQAAQGG